MWDSGERLVLCSLEVLEVDDGGGMRSRKALWNRGEKILSTATSLVFVNYTYNITYFSQ